MNNIIDLIDVSSLVLLEQDHSFLFKLMIDIQEFSQLNNMNSVHGFVNLWLMEMILLSEQTTRIVTVILVSVS